MFLLRGLCWFNVFILLLMLLIIAAAKACMRESVILKLIKISLKPKSKVSIESIENMSDFLYTCFNMQNLEINYNVTGNSNLLRDIKYSVDKSDVDTYKTNVREVIDWYLAKEK